MRLVACEKPEGPLEAAPRSALLVESDLPAGDGFWGDDDRYYARVEADGSVRWYTLENAPAGTPRALSAVSDVPVTSEPPRRLALVARGGGDRQMLVWATRARRRG